MEDEDLKGQNQSEDTIFLKIFKQLKQQTFDIVSVMLSQDYLRIEVRYFMILIESIQILHFYFKNPLKELWKAEDTVNVIADVTSFTTITPLIAKLNWSEYKFFFWIFVGIFLFIIISILIILYSLKKKISGQDALQKFLKFSTDILCSIGYLPFLEMYFSVFNCGKDSQDSQDSKDSYMHRNFTELKCYQGEHTTYMFTGAILAFLLFLYVSVNTFINFECRFNSKNNFTKTSGRQDVIFVVYKTICVILTTLLYSDQYQILLIVIMGVLSAWLFMCFNFNVYYNNDKISKVVTSMHSINFWAVLMLILAYITYDQSFSFSIYLFLIGTPSIFYIIMIRVQQKYDIILLNSNNYKSIELAQTQLLYLTKLLFNYNKDPQTKTILNGFLDYHRTICNIEDCSSKQRVMKTTNFSNQLRGEGESENLITIISVIQSMYYICLQKFPSSTRLRILYSLYLLDITKSKQQAIQELNNAQLEIPALDEQFIIFRYQTIIENELITGNGKNQKGEQNESVNELSIQNYLQACRQNIEKSASMHTEFWSQLQDQTPDLGKLSELGFKINIINSRVEDYYNKLIQLTYCMPAIQRYYAKFLIQILHDKEKGNQILEKMFFSNAKGNSNMIDMENEPRPTIFMSAEDDSFCQIKNANLAAGCALGYSKIEIINRNIKVIMPHLYAQYHNSFIYNYLNTLEPQILGIERYLPAKTKQDYLLPINVNVRNVPSLIHGLQFSGQFFIDKHLNITCHMIIDTEGLLLNISSSSLPILDINVKKVEKNKYQVDEIIPGFFDKLGDEKEGLLSKHGLKVDCFNLKIRKKPKPFNANVNVIKINFRQVNLQGYLIKIQKTKDLFTLEEEQKMHIHNSTIKKHLFLNYNRETGEYYGQIENGPPSRGHSHLNSSNVQDLSATRLNSDVDRSKINDKSIIKDSKNMTTNNNMTIRKQQNLVQSQNTPINNNHIQLSQKFSNSDQENMDRVLDEDGNEILVPQFKNWGEKIRTVRFINGKQYDIEDLKREEEDVVEQLQQEEIQNMENQGIDKFGNQVEDEKQGFQVQKLFKKKTIFVKFIKESKYLKVKSMINLRYYSACVVFTMCVLALINYFVIVNILNQSSERYNLVSLSYRQISNSQSILSNILQIYAENKYKDPSSYDSNLIEQAKKSIRFALNDLEDIQNYLQANTLSINEDHKQLLQENIVSMRFKLDSEYGYELYNLNEATQQIITKVNSLVNQDTQNFKPESENFNFLQYNLFNSYSMSLKTSSTYFVDELQKWAEEKQSIFIYLLVIAIIIVIVNFILFIPFYLLILESQKEILTLFLDIPQKKIKTFFKRCEEFSKSAQQGNEEEINSDEKLFNLSDDEDNKLLNHGRNKGKKRKKFRINHKNGKVFFIPFLICAIVFLVYFVLSYILSKNLSNKYYIFVKEYNYTNTAEGFMGFSNNALRQLLIDENFTVLNGTQLQDYVEDSVLNMYSIMSGIQSEYTENLKYHYTEYIDAFQNVMIKERDINTCDILVNRKNVSQTICEQFMDNAMLQGFSIALARHFENFRILQSQFEYEKSIDPSYANNGTLFYQNIVTQMYEMQEDYISNLFRYLIEQFQSSLEVLQTNSNGAKVTILICCIILIIFIYLILWVPLISNTNVEIVRIRSMITMIPLDVCANTPSIRIILGKYITNDFEK